MSLTPYTACCVRACALRNGLLLPGEWPVLAGLHGPGAAIEWLKKRGVLPDDAGDVPASERAAHESVIRNASGLLRFASGPLAELLRFFVHHYDLLNVEGVIHRIHAVPDGDVRPRGRFFDTGALGLVRPGTLDAVTNYPALARALRHTPFSKSFENALSGYHEDEDVVRLVERVEVAFFADWVRAAGRCGLCSPAAAPVSALGVFLCARAIGSAVRLKVHRRAPAGRIVEWLSPVAGGGRLNECLAALSHETEQDPARKLADILLPAACRVDLPAESGPRGEWGFLDMVVMRQALKAMRGIAFNADFLTAFLVLDICQARELTVLLESKEADIAMPGLALGGTRT